MPAAFTAFAYLATPTKSVPINQLRRYQVVIGSRAAPELFLPQSIRDGTLVYTHSESAVSPTRRIPGACAGTEN